MILYITERNIRIDDADNQISYNSDTIAGKVYICTAAGTSSTIGTWTEITR